LRTYTRAISLKLYNTKLKQRKIIALIEAYRHAVNFYLKSFKDQKGKLDKETLARLQATKLSERYKSNALKQALGIYKSCVKKTKKIPCFKGYPILDKKFVNIQSGQNSFDIWIKLSTLAKGKRIHLPTKKHKRLNYWLNKGKLLQGCELHPNKLIVWVEVEKQHWKTGKSLGVDLGMQKLIATSSGDFFGKHIAALTNKILRKKKNSNSYKRVLRERDNYVNQEINKLNWSELGVLAYENLTNISKGKSGLRKYKRFRVKQQHWVYRKVITRIIEKCEENRVRPIYVNPQNTSRTCPICNNVDEASRKLDKFYCLNCGYEQDADTVGAINIKSKALYWLESLESSDSKS